MLGHIHALTHTHVCVYLSRYIIDRYFCVGLCACVCVSVFKGLFPRSAPQFYTYVPHFAIWCGNTVHMSNASVSSDNGRACAKNVAIPHICATHYYIKSGNTSVLLCMPDSTLSYEQYRSIATFWWQSVAHMCRIVGLTSERDL